MERWFPDLDAPGGPSSLRARMIRAGRGRLCTTVALSAALMQVSGEEIHCAVVNQFKDTQVAVTDGISNALRRPEPVPVWKRRPWNIVQAKRHTTNDRRLELRDTAIDVSSAHAVRLL